MCYIKNPAILSIYFLYSIDKNSQLRQVVSVSIQLVDAWDRESLHLRYCFLVATGQKKQMKK